MDEKLTITRTQLEQLKEYSGQCIARIVGCTSGDAGEVIGTGTFIIEYVQTLVLHVIQRESAYFRWEHRGRAHGDDQVAWFAAEEDISLL